MNWPLLQATLLDWPFILAALMYVVALHIETRRKAAEGLLMIGGRMNANLAPNWVYGGMGKPALAALSLIGGLAGAALMAYDWLPSVGGVGATGIFLALLYAKYFISVRRSQKRIESAVANHLRL